MPLLMIQRALVMEEDSSTRLLITESLKSWGIPEVEDYATETLSLQRLLRGRFDLAIFDLGIWSSPIAAGGPTLVIATYPLGSANDASVILKAKRQGADTLVEKPFKRLRLLRSIEAILSTPAARRLKIVELPTSRFRLGIGREQSS
ncbi:MAG: hypothetical protein Q8M31_21520 [Beijerinckiaceae bacterium]|nr:hypothetical protein [Beijerinckiaceae bacterium]